MAGRHPYVRARGTVTPREAPGRALLVTTDIELQGMIEQELAVLEIDLKVVRSVAPVIAALIDDPPPRAQLLLADFDALSPGDVVQLHDLRERGWFGAILGLGRVPAEFGTSLNIRRILPRPLAGDAVRRAVAAIGLVDRTRRIATLRNEQ